MGFTLSLKEIANRLSGRLSGEGDLKVSLLAIDSRTISSSESILFIALVGDRHDGHAYLRDVYARGVRAFLVSRLPDSGSFPGAGFCLISDTLKGLQQLALVRRENFFGNLVAITGSNGKTIVKEWIFQCLADQLNISRSPKSYNSQVGVPLSIWMIRDDNQVSVIEAGISLPGEMERLERIIRPDTGIFTNIGSAHQENFRNLEEKLKEKLLMFHNCKKIIFRADSSIEDRPLTPYFSSLNSELISWSLDGEALYSYSIRKREMMRTDLTVRFNQEDYRFNLPFSDSASIENALHTLTFLLESGLNPETAFRKIGKIEPVNMRLEMLRGVMGSILINDAYNADIAGLSSALDLLNRQDAKLEKVLVLSDMLQSGMEDAALYTEVARLIKLKGIDRFIGIGITLSHHRDIFREGSQFFSDTDEFIRRIDRTRFKECVVLIKGSRKFGFERITGELQLKTHQTSLEIDLNAMVLNLNYFKSILKEKVKTMVIVKALSYGSGNMEIANLLQYQQVDYLAVAFIDEGVDLRKSGIYLPIMVLNPDPAGYGQMIDYQLEPEIYGFKGLNKLKEILQYRGISDYPIHIKVDTGMHRLGFSREELNDLAPLIQQNQFRILSVFSHLAASDQSSQDEFTYQQIQQFSSMSDLISEVISYRFDRHILNSSGIERFPEAQFEMVRLGIGLHGIGLEKSLIPASSFKTVISQIRTLRKGETIGYSRAGRVNQESVIGTIPVGYADGFNRRLGNGAGSVMVNGVPVPTIGHICMDMTMIDLTGLTVSEGTEVEIFGKRQPVTLLAEQAGTIPYEMLTGISERVKRVYLQE